MAANCNKCLSPYEILHKDIDVPYKGRNILVQNVEVSYCSKCDIEELTVNQKAAFELQCTRAFGEHNS